VAITKRMRTGGDASPSRRQVSVQARLMSRLLLVLETGPVLILVILSLVLWRVEPTFTTKSNIQNILIQTSVVGVLAVGELIVILTGGIDLSVGTGMALATVVGSFAYRSHLFHSGGLVIVVMVLVGVALGTTNGLIYIFGRIPHPFIVTLGTLSVAEGLGLTLSKGQPLTGMPPIVNTLGNGFLGPVPVPVLVLLGVALVGSWLTKTTQWGRWIYATGGNVDSARRVGIPVSRVLISVYVVSGLMAGVGAVLTAGSIDGASATLGEDPVTLLNSIAGVIIGGASLFGGRGSVWNAIVGALTIGVIENGLALLNISPFAESIFVGATILVAVELDVVRANVERRVRALRANQAIA
jgi:ribose transport system permease protein